MASVERGAKVVSANRLDTGAVVWLGADLTWVDRVTAAAVVEDEAALAALARAKESERAGIVVEPFLVEVEIEGGYPQPVRPRERIRSQGPSVRPDLGYQALSRP